MFKTEKFGIDPRFAQLSRDMLAFYVGKSNYLCYGERDYFSPDRSTVPYYSSRGAMLPVGVFARLYGGERLCTLDTECVGGVEYSPVGDICAALGLYLHEERNGLIIVTPSDISSELDWVRNLNLMRNIITSFSYDDVTGEELLRLIGERHPNNAHPRLIFTADKFAAIRSQLADPKGDPVYKKLYEKLLHHADRFLCEPPIEYHIPDGIRLLYVCRENCNRMLILSIVYNLSGDERYAKAAWRVLSTVCAFPDFNPYHFLDVGEMACGVGLCYDWLYGWLDEEKRRTVRDALVKKAIYPIIEDFDDKPRARSWNWRGELADNWRLVIAGICVSALAIMDELDGEELVSAERAAEQTLYDIRRALALFAPYGAYEEGHGYWYFAMLYYTYLAKSLMTATGTDFGYVDVVGMRHTNRYMLAVNGPVSTFDYHDCDHHDRNIPPQMMFLADYFGRYAEALPRVREIMRDGEEGALECISDMFLYNPEFLKASESGADLDLCLPVAEIASMRSGNSEGDMWLGFHCDDPIGGEGHDHMDSGTFVLDALGESFIVDTCRDNYNLPNYNNCYRVREEGHNVIVLNPDADYSMRWGGTAAICDFVSAEHTAYAVGELSQAYREDHGVISYRRGAALMRAERAAVIRDELELSREGEAYWFAHTRADITLTDGGRGATLTVGGKTLYARIISDGFATFSVMDAVPLPTSPKIEGQNMNEGMRKLTVHLPRVKKIALTVAFAESESTFKNIKAEPISSWKETVNNA